MTTHLTDSEIQRLAEEEAGIEKQLSGHLTVCAACKKKYEIYQSLFREIKFSYFPVVPNLFAARVIELVAMKKEEQRIMRSYHVSVAIVTGLGLIAILLLLQYPVIKSTIINFIPVSAGNINVVEAILVMGTIGILYVCLSGYNSRFKKNYLFSDITL